MQRASSSATDDPTVAPIGTRRVTWVWGAAIFLLAFGLRAGWGLYRMSGGSGDAGLEFPDEVDYWNLARSLAQGHGLVGEHGFRALRMPVYPAFLSLFADWPNGAVWARCAQWLAGGLTALVCANLGAALFGRGAGRLAGLAVACDPFLVFFSSLLLVETLFILALVSLWYLGMAMLRAEAPPRLHRWVAFGIASAACVYLRESSFGLAVVWAAFVAWRAHPRPRRARFLAGPTLALAVVGLALLPWAIRNQRVTGQWTWLTHRAGISLYDGVGPQATGASDLAEVKQMPDVRGLNETAWNAYFLDRSFRAIRSDPVRMLRLAVVKLARTWNPWPNVKTHRDSWSARIVGLWTLAVYLLVAVGLVGRDRGARRWALALLLPALYFAAVHAVFVGSVRYRLPAMPMMEMLAAVTLARGLDHAFRRVIGQTVSQRNGAGR